MEEGNAPPLVYSSFRTRQRSYPQWIIIHSSPLPTPVQRASIGNEFCSALLSSHHAVEVPPSMNNVADSLGWFLSEAPYPLNQLYHIVVKQLYLSCQSGSHINLSDFHNKTILMAMKSCFRVDVAGPETSAIVMDSLKREIAHRWGDGVRFARFDLVLIECYNYLLEVRRD